MKKRKLNERNPQSPRRFDRHTGRARSSLFFVASFFLLLILREFRCATDGFGWSAAAVSESCGVVLYRSSMISVSCGTKLSSRRLLDASSEVSCDGQSVWFQ